MALVQSSNVNSEDSMDIVIHPPNTSEAVFAAATFPYDRLMESWAVVGEVSGRSLEKSDAITTASTLPLWRKRKNVTITYSPLEGVDPSESFLDTVTFNNINSDENKDPSTVVGIDVHDKNAPDNLTEDREATSTDLNGLRFKWDGKGLLSVSSAKWQVLGFFLAQDSTRHDEDWVVTYFASTLVSDRPYLPGASDLAQSRYHSSPPRGWIYTSGGRKTLRRRRYRNLLKFASRTRMRQSGRCRRSSSRYHEIDTCSGETRTSKVGGS